jgi:hypothetical protein
MQLAAPLAKRSMLERMARVVHATVGAGAVVLAAVHIFSVTMVSENPGGLWLLGMAVLVPGAFMAAGARTLGGGAVLATAALAVASMVELFAYRATMPAAFTIAAGVDALLLSLHLGSQRRWAALGAAVLLCAVVAVGLGDAVFVALPVDP